MFTCYLEEAVAFEKSNFFCSCFKIWKILLELKINYCSKHENNKILLYILQNEYFRTWKCSNENNTYKTSNAFFLKQIFCSLYIFKMFHEFSFFFKTPDITNGKHWYILQKNLCICFFYVSLVARSWNYTDKLY